MPGDVLKLQVVVQVMPLLVVLKQDRRVGRVLACRAEEVDVQHAEGFVVLEDAPGVGQDVVHVHDDLRGGGDFGTVSFTTWCHFGCNWEREQNNPAI